MLKLYSAPQMRSALSLAICTLVTGCNIVLGLDEVSQGHIAPDAQLPRVTGTLSERYVVNNPDGTPKLLERVYDAADIGIGVTLADGSTPTVDYRADGTFEFERQTADQTYRLVITIESGHYEYQLDMPELQILRFAAGRPSPTPLQGSTVQFGYPAVVAGLVPAQIASTGVFMSLSTSQYGPMVSIDWRSALPTGNSRPGMLEASEGDRLYAFESRYDSTTRPGLNYGSLTGMSVAQVTLIPGQVTTLAAPAAVTRNACAHLVTPNATELARIVAALPDRSYVYPGGDWYVFGVPSTSLGLTGAYPIAYAGEPTALDSENTIPFFDPFVGWDLIGQAGSVAGFDMTIPGTTQPLRLYNAVRRYRPLARGPIDCSQPALSLAATVAIPGRVVMAGVSLDVDDKAIALPATDIDVTWQIVAPGVSQISTATLFELVGSTDYATTAARRSIVVTGTRAVFDRSLFQQGRRYIVAVTISTGRPNAATGDFATLMEPFDSATTWSHSFVVP